MTPVKMKQFESQDAYMDLTPEQFKSQLDIIEAMRLAPQETLSGQDAAYVKEEEAGRGDGAGADQTRGGRGIKERGSRLSDA